ncbi:hypothetical protein GWK47_038647 [Chionoecetes opilio]|uniref:Uncharacterized protein n=1 Tax=Chionoecetes opilio TaxID=41210 RepID=A0A8J5D1S6_CHIOP|nr:hypothetical protein GWK47_038647 [Chionoecetes opilio]
MEVEEEEDSLKDVVNEMSVMNTLNSQSGSIVKEYTVDSEVVGESQTMHAKEKDESVASESMPLLRCSSSRVSICDSTPPSTPEKFSPAKTTLPSRHLYLSTPLTSPQKPDDPSSSPVSLSMSPLCTPFATPQKPDDPSSSPVALSMSPLCTPILTAPSPSKETLQGLTQRNLTTDLNKSEESQSHGASGSLVKNTSHTKSQSAKESAKTSTRVNKATQSPVAALVTYEGSGLSKERSVHLIDITPGNSRTRLCKISPSKTFKSPIKTSPLKHVSPILRKYHRYSPKKRNIRSGKLLPILPKYTARQQAQAMRRRQQAEAVRRRQEALALLKQQGQSSRQRRLAPRPENPLPMEASEIVAAQHPSRQVLCVCVCVHSCSI